MREFLLPPRTQKISPPKTNLEYCPFYSGMISAGGGSRTHTVLLPLDFESSASAISPLRRWIRPTLATLMQIGKTNSSRETINVAVHDLTCHRPSGPEDLPGPRTGPRTGPSLTRNWKPEIGARDERNETGNQQLAQNRNP